MSSLELRTRGWTRTTAPTAILTELFGHAMRREPIDVGQLGRWSTLRPVDPHRPIVMPEYALHIAANAEVAVRVLPGSQGLDLPTKPGVHAVDINLGVGESLLADPGLWTMVDCPERVTASLIEARPPAGTERLDVGEDFEWHSQGFTMLRGALTHQRAAALSAALDAGFASAVATWGTDHLKRIGQYGAIRNLPDLGQDFIDLLGDSPVNPLLDRVLRAGYILHSFDGLILAPGEGRFPWDFHTDLESLVGFAPVRSRVPAVNVLYYLDRVTPENGATWLVPCSHLSSWSSPDTDAAANFAVQAVGEAGDILVFDARVSHCAGNNTTDRSRRLIKTLFCEPWIQPQMDYRRALSDGKWDGLPSRVKGVLGAGTSCATSTVEFLQRMALKAS
jgi:hypothetical protein